MSLRVAVEETRARDGARWQRGGGGGGGARRGGGIVWGGGGRGEAQTRWGAGRHTRL